MVCTIKLILKFLQKQVEKLLADVEKLKDSNRSLKYKNGGSN